MREKSPFTVQESMPGVFHIKDPLDVCVTLLVGRDAALLFDTGYGLFPLPGLVRSLTDKPLSVLLSHGHHDHAGGACQFPQVWIGAADMPVCGKYTAADMRRKVWQRAEKQGCLPQGFDAEAYENAGTGPVFALDREVFPLGGLTAQVVPMPGHTPGAVGLLVPEHDLLLVGDSWNPVTWLFFPESGPARDYARMLRGIRGLPFRQVLASHYHPLVPGERLAGYIDGLTSECLHAARPVVMPGYEDIHVRSCRPGGDTILYFNGDTL